MNLTPEQRLKIAKWTGRRGTFNAMTEEVYTPDTNDSQAMELLQRLIDKGWYLGKSQDDKQYSLWKDGGPYIYNSYLGLSICHAVLALLENDNV